VTNIFIDKNKCKQINAKLNERIYESFASSRSKSINTDANNLTYVYISLK